jgi:neutral ceramidase
MSRLTRWCAVTLVCAAAGCSRPGVLEQLPAPESPTPVPARTFRAGLAKRDITPPPGVGLMGNGPEGARSRGYRQRLYARAVFLEDARGERLALVTADLAHISAVLHRKAAARLIRDCREAGIGADRLFISATHTHSGPGHFYEAANYNESGSSVPGYDPLIVDSLSAKLAAAVCAAGATLRPARAAWGSTLVWGVSRIRSLAAMQRNSPPPEPLAPPPQGLSPAERLVNPTLWVLRVDTAGAAGTWAPAGGWAAFSVHNTANAPSGDLLDSDIHGRVSQLVERFIDLMAGHPARSAGPARSTFAFANGAHGDVSPAWEQESRCPLPHMHPNLEPTGPLVRARSDWHGPDGRTLARCDRAARRTLERLARRIADAATELFDALGAAAAPELGLARAFRTIDLEDSLQRGPLCERPAAGMATFAGAPDSYSRTKGWRVLGLIPLGIEEPSPRSGPNGCHGHKAHLVSESFNYRAAGLKLPTSFQLAAVRVGDRLLLFTPAEVTTTAGRRLRAAALERASGAGVPVRDAIPISLTNGFIQYLTTPDEYGAQYYEGASTLYGPEELRFFADQLGALTQSLAGEPTVVLRPIASRPGRTKAVAPRLGTAGPNSAALLPRLTDSLWCGSDTLYAAFNAGRPGEWIGDAGPKVELFAGSDTTVAAWDDDPRVAMHLTKRRAPAGWQLRFTPGDGGRYELRLAGTPTRHRWPCTATAPG